MPQIAEAHQPLIKEYAGDCIGFAFRLLHLGFMAFGHTSASLFEQEAYRLTVCTES